MNMFVTGSADSRSASGESRMSTHRYTSWDGFEHSPVSDRTCVMPLQHTRNNCDMALAVFPTPSHLPRSASTL
jgi:hypothetical protein